MWYNLVFTCVKCPMYQLHNFRFHWWFKWLYTMFVIYSLTITDKTHKQQWDWPMGFEGLGTNQADWVGCLEYWFHDTSNHCMQFLCLSLFCHVNNLSLCSNKKSYCHGSFNFWNSYVSSLQPYENSFGAKTNMWFNPLDHITCTVNWFLQMSQKLK